MNKQIDKTKSTFKDFFRKELFFAARFGLVGGLATFIHMFIVWILIEKSLAPVLSSNLFAFMIAFSFSFSGNYYWTFRKPGNKERLMLRFFIISASAFAVNTLFLTALLNARWLSPITSTLSATLVIPLITFLASRLWGFNVQENSCSVNQIHRQ